MLGATEADRLMETTSSNFPPRPDTINPDWWHVWKEVDENVTGYLKLGADAVMPEDVLIYIRNFTSDVPKEDGHAFQKAQMSSMRPEDQGMLEHMMAAMVMLMQLGIESNFTVFRQEVVEATSSNWAVDTYCRSVFNEIVELMEVAPYDNSVFNVVDVSRDGIDASKKGLGTKRAILSHHEYFIEWYRAQINDCVSMWLDAAEESLEEDLRKDDPGYARSVIVLTADYVTMHAQAHLND